MYITQPTSTSTYRELATVKYYRYPDASGWWQPVDPNLVPWTCYYTLDDDPDEVHFCSIPCQLSNGQTKNRSIWSWTGWTGNGTYDGAMTSDKHYYLNEIINRCDLMTYYDIWRYGIPTLNVNGSSGSTLRCNINTSSSGDGYGLVSVTWLIRPLGYVSTDTYTFYDAMQGTTTVTIDAHDLNSDMSSSFLSAMRNKWGSNNIVGGITYWGSVGNSIVFGACYGDMFFRATPYTYTVHSHAGRVMDSHPYSVYQNTNGGYSQYGSNGATHGLIYTSMVSSSSSSITGFITDTWPQSNYIGAKITIPMETERPALCISGSPSRYTLSYGSETWIKFN